MLLEEKNGRFMLQWFFRSLAIYPVWFFDLSSESFTFELEEANFFGILLTLLFFFPNFFFLGIGDEEDLKNNSRTLLRIFRFFSWCDWRFILILFVIPSSSCWISVKYVNSKVGSLLCWIQHHFLQEPSGLLGVTQNLHILLLLCSGSVYDIDCFSFYWYFKYNYALSINIIT